uniref:Uncharacterized protein n=1 Tax=Rhizophora mucronata TaxID=61149 RepID=A0A2P2QKS5_RHIMU
MFWIKNDGRQRLKGVETLK